MNMYKRKIIRERKERRNISAWFSSQKARYDFGIDVIHNIQNK